MANSAIAMRIAVISVGLLLTAIDTIDSVATAELKGVKEIDMTELEYTKEVLAKLVQDSSEDNASMPNDNSRQ
jgi:hypothetical protein